MTLLLQGLDGSIKELKDILVGFRRDLIFSWDDAITNLGVKLYELELNEANDKYKNVLDAITSLYSTAYTVMKDVDVDGGVCGVIRKHIVNMLVEIEKELRENE